MSLYATSSTHPKSKTKTRPAIMRETLTQPEGLLLTSLSSQSQDPQQISTHLSTTHWSSIPSLNQRLTNPPSAPPGTLPNITHLLPQPTHLCTKRSKRCLACRHILIKPDIKVQSIRFRVRLVAMSFVPLIKLVPLPPQPSATPSQPISLSSIPPLVPTNLVLTIQNHLFDPITITLSTPAITPGRFSHRITLLCPTFEVGANSDLFDEALNPNLAVPSSKTRGSTNSSSESSSGAVEAGKIWAKGRNWTSVILEIVPASLKAPNPAQKNMSFGEAPKGKENGELGLEDDEDVLEIPIFVHLEYETDLDKAEQREREQQGKPPATSEKRELNYWMVLGVGKVAIV
jgi:dynactin 4